MDKEEVNRLKETLRKAGYNASEIALIVDAHLSGGPDKAIETARKLDAAREAKPSPTFPNTNIGDRPRSLGYVAKNSPALPIEGDDEVAKLRRKKKRNPQADLGLAWLRAADRSKRKRMPTSRV